MLVFPGDLLQARESHATETLNAWHVWRARHAGLPVVLVEGNHDRHAGALLDTLAADGIASSDTRTSSHATSLQRKIPSGLA
jgi:3',5'-cyclic AMP phosphodiesterase CpdA